MLKAVFIGSKNEFNEILVHWLSRRVEVAGVVWTNATAWQKSWRGRFEFARRRMRRYGFLKVLNEVLGYCYLHAFLSGGEVAELQRRVIIPYFERHGVPAWRGDSIVTADVNAPEALSFISERRPDIVLAMCINNYFGKRLRALPRLGVFLWHEGYTPEYKGLYSPFWALHNLEFERLGYTLLRMNDEYDAGEVFVQGRASGFDPFRHNNQFIGHKAIMDSLPAVEKFLAELETGEAKPIERPGAPSRTYTYPGLTDFIRQRLRLRRLARRSVAGPLGRDAGSGRQA